MAKWGPVKAGTFAAVGYVSAQGWVDNRVSFVREGTFDSPYEAAILSTPISKPPKQ